MDDPLLTVQEVAEQWRMNPQTVRNYIDAGQLPAVRIGSRRVRIRQSSVDQFVRGDDHGPRPTLVGRVEELEEQVARLTARLARLEAGSDTETD